MHWRFRFRRGLWAVPLFALLLGACADPLRTSTGADPVQVLVGSGPATTRADPAEILRAELEGDTLDLQVRFGGGCAEHDFALVHSGAFMESYPVQTNLTLAHDAHGDACRALLTRAIRFDLSPVKRAYQQGYAEHGVIVIHLRSPGPGTAALSVRYEF